ncbi:MAG: metal-dependent hydrolase [Bacteroidota bacterium]|jgi:L-ascorbate metabolism protein UlaG (beta-lactamase superfamily)|nr:metal-dependent hydrolase [Bacteroidota bacterium]
MEITYYGHSCFGVKINGKTILFDPFISPNELAKEINIDTVEADYILISHGHEDHIADAVSIAKRTNALVVTNWEIALWLQKQGIENIHPMNIGGKKLFDFGSVKCVNAVHSSSLPDGSYGGHPMGFVIESNDKNFYYAGDTALTYDMKLIGEYRQIDFAFLPIGDNFTMGVDNAILCCKDFIKCNDIIGMHYDTFAPIQIDKPEAINKFNRQGKKLSLLEIGETITK